MVTVEQIKNWASTATNDKVPVILWVDGQERIFELTGICGGGLEHGIALVIQTTDKLSK